jgi:hypothetical protein
MQVLHGNWGGVIAFSTSFYAGPAEKELLQIQFSEIQLKSWIISNWALRISGKISAGQAQLRHYRQLMKTYYETTYENYHAHHAHIS